MKKLYIFVGSLLTTALTLVLFIDWSGAATGDVLYILQKVEVKTLSIAQKVMLKNAVLASFPGTNGENVDALQCDISIINQNYDTGTTREEGTKEDGTPNIVPVFANRNVVTLSCEVFDEKSMSALDFAKLDIEGKLKLGKQNNVLVSLGKKQLYTGSSETAVWNTFTQSLFNKNLHALYKFKVYRYNKEDKTKVTANAIPLKIASPETFKADRESGVATKALLILE